MNTGIQLENSIHRHFIFSGIFFSEDNLTASIFFLSMSLQYELILPHLKTTNTPYDWARDLFFISPAPIFIIISIFGGVFFIYSNESSEREERVREKNTHQLNKQTIHDRRQNSQQRIYGLIFTLQVYHNKAWIAMYILWIICIYWILHLLLLLFFAIFKRIWNVRVWLKKMSKQKSLEKRTRRVRFDRTKKKRFLLHQFKAKKKIPRNFSKKLNDCFYKKIKLNTFQFSISCKEKSFAF